MPVNLPSVSASTAHRAITLGDLRDLVDAATGLPPETVVRGAGTPFDLSALGNPLGPCLVSVSLDEPGSAPSGPNRAARRAAGGKQ